MGAPDVKLPHGIVDVATKVLAAWVVIRGAVQIIPNPALRHLLAVIVSAVAFLSILGVLGEVTRSMDAIAFTLGGARISLLTLFKVTVTLLLLLYLAIFLSTLAERRIHRIQKLNRATQVLFSKSIRIMLITLALLLSITSSGIDLSLFAVFGGAVGLGLGFGLQKVVSNLFSGMLLLLDQSIKPGDVIELENGTFGWISRMAARYTEVVTRDNKSYLIPNEDFITQRVLNWSYGNSLIRLKVEFGVHYESDPHEVVAVAAEAAKKSPRVLAEPPPVCWPVGFGESSIDFALLFWIRDPEAGLINVKEEVFLALWDALKAHDIHIPYPHREIYVHNAS